MKPISTFADRLNELVAAGKKPSAIVQAILDEARGTGGVSDVHFEPVEDGLQLRFRLDGVLQPVAAAPAELAAPIIARLKVLAELATYRTDVPQDGSIRLDGSHASGGGTSLRLSTYPTVRGEKAVVRLFAARAEDFALERLGLSEPTLAILREQARSREGLLVFTGPAGSGKTTTMYSLIQHLRDHSSVPRQIVTIEDPAECLLPGITQTETNPPAGLTFANCLRSILRQDPEVIMVGEVRDRETAQLAIEAALTGHLVLTTLHAGTAAGVFSRLLEMDLEPSLITSVVRVAVAVRLVRRLCSSCRRREGESWNAPGCDACLGTGYRNRLALDESLTLAPAVRQAVLARGDAEQIENAAREAGMTPLSTRGRALVAAGETSEEEVARVLAGHGRSVSDV